MSHKERIHSMCGLPRPPTATEEYTTTKKWDRRTFTTSCPRRAHWHAGVSLERNRRPSTRRRIGTCNTRVTTGIVRTLGALDGRVASDERQPRHYVKAGNRIMVPKRQRNHKLAKWLKNAGWRIDMTSMDNMFVTFYAHNHYFTMHWSSNDKVFTLCDPLASQTTPDHNEAMMLLWAFLLASARADDNLWTMEPRLSLSESQVLGGFRSFLLCSPRREERDVLTEGAKENLRRLGIEVQGATGSATGAWTWKRDTNFPQQSNGNDCGMVAVVAVTHLARGWQLSAMNETVINRYRQWLVQAINKDSEDVFNVPCQLQANQQGNAKKKSPSAQVKHTGSCKHLDVSRRSSGANQHQGRQVAEGEEMPIDPPALNDDTPSQ